MTPIATLGGMTPPSTPDTPTVPMPNPGGKGLGGGGGSAQDGLGQVNSGASTIGNAIGQAQSALGGGGGGGLAQPQMYKNGGAAKKSYTNGGKINLGACGVSTASKGKKNSDW
jgi:hypothetical protein